MRGLITDFSLANSFYAGCQVTAWLADPVTFAKTANKATLYADLTSTRTLLNPQTLDGEGRFPVPVYFDDPIVLEITGDDVPDHDTGVIQPQARARGTWATATDYWVGDLVIDGANGANTQSVYYCLSAHTSGVWATDLAAGKWLVLMDFTALVAATVAQLTATGIGIEEAANDGNAYVRQSEAWSEGMTKAAIEAADAALQAQISAASGLLYFIGAYDATLHTADYTAASGFADGALVAASAASGRYLFVTVAGTGAAPAPVVAMAVGDMLVSDGTNWTLLPVAMTLPDTNISTTGLTGITSTDVHGALAEIISDLSAEIATRTANDTSEANARIAADNAEATTRGNADTALAADIVTAQSAAQAFATAADTTAFTLPGSVNTYGRQNGAWVEVVKRNVRTTAATTDTPTTADKDGFIGFTAATAVSVTANDLGANVSYSVQQQGNGQVTITAGAGVTLVSDKASASYVTARRGAILTITCNGSNTVFVTGNSA